MKEIYQSSAAQVIIKAIGLTLIWYVVNLVLGQRQTVRRSLVLFFILLIGILVINSVLPAECPESEKEDELFFADFYQDPSVEFDLDAFFGDRITSDIHHINGQYVKYITETQRREMIRVIDECNRRGHYYFQAAERKCWYLPNVSERTKATYCFSSIGGGLLVPGDLRSKIISALGTMLIQYGCECINEWYEINDLLEKSRMNFETAELWQSCLDFYQN